ncbi:MAG TPA: gamma-glutamyltransferase [Alphaproteobacteria bacterium]
MKTKTTIGRKYAVVSGHALATEAALDVLKAGGNPVDAAIAGGAVLTVALPQACTLAGDCFILVHVGGRTYGLNGSGPSPAGLPADIGAEQLSRGPLSSAVPGMLGALEALHRRFGSRAWAELMAPAASLARDGVPASREFVASLKMNLDKLTQDPGHRALYLPGGTPPAEGDMLRQPALAATLERVAKEGAAALYGGWIGDRLCEALARLGGVMTRADLAAYRPLWVEPLSYDYRGRTVRVMPPNSYGLAMLLQLAALERAPVGRHALGSPERLALLMRAARAAFAIASPYIADPHVAGDRAADALAPASLAALRTAFEGAAAAYPPRGQGTAVISVGTAAGEGVTIVQSIFAPFGSFVADAETGLIFNNRLHGFTTAPGHPNRAAPGKRPAHTLNPAMMFEGGRLAMQLGSPGGSGQTITLTQVLTGVIDLQLDLEAAIAAPRWSMDLEGNFALEPEIDADMPRRLAALGVAARPATEDQRYYFGSAECIAQDPRTGLRAVADFRREAAAGAG